MLELASVAIIYPGPAERFAKLVGETFDRVVKLLFCSSDANNQS